MSYFKSISRSFIRWILRTYLEKSRFPPTTNCNAASPESNWEASQMQPGLRLYGGRLTRQAPRPGSGEPLVITRKRPSWEDQGRQKPCGRKRSVRAACSRGGRMWRRTTATLQHDHGIPQDSQLRADICFKTTADALYYGNRTVDTRNSNHRFWTRRSQHGAVRTRLLSECSYLERSGISPEKQEQTQRNGIAQSGEGAVEIPIQYQGEFWASKPDVPITNWVCELLEGRSLVRTREVP